MIYNWNRFDWTGGFTKNNDSADDVRALTFKSCIFSPVRSASKERAGDLLVVDSASTSVRLKEISGAQRRSPKQNGGGFDRSTSSLAQKSIWDIKGL